MLQLDSETKKKLISLKAEKNIYLEGNILKIVEAGDDLEFKKYLDEAIFRDKENRRNRLTITKQVQAQNLELTKWKEQNEKIQEELKESLKKTEDSMQEANLLKEEAENAREEAIIAKNIAENAKAAVENDLDLMQKKRQFELIGVIVKVSLYVILGVGVAVTGMYLFAISANADTQVIGSTWSNIVSILLTNAFSIVGTIMGVKYASEKSE